MSDLLYPNRQDMFRSVGCPPCYKFYDGRRLGGVNDFLKLRCGIPANKFPHPTFHGSPCSSESPSGDPASIEASAKESLQVSLVE